MPRRKPRAALPDATALSRAVRLIAAPLAIAVVGAIVLSLERTPYEVPHDFAAVAFGLLVVYAAFEGGALSGLACGAIAWTILAMMLSYPRFFMFEASDRARLISMAVALPSVSLLVSWFRGRLTRDNAKLREAEQMWRLLSAHVPDVVMTVRRDGIVHYVNRPLTWAPPERGNVVGRMFVTLLPEDRREQARKMLSRAFSNGGETRLEIGLPGLDGGPAMFDLRIVPVRRGGETFAALASFTDESRRMEAEEAHERLSAIVKVSNAAIFGTTADGTITSWNQGARRMYGYAPDEIVGKNLSALLPGGMAGEEAAKLLARAAKGEHIEQMETEHRRKDGSPLDVAVTLSPIGEHGKLAGLALVVRDLGARKAAEAERRKTTELLAEAERIAHVGSWEWEKATDEMTWTDELYRIYGLEPGAQRPTLASYLQQINIEDRERVKQAVKKARSEAVPFSFDHRITRPDGDERVLRAHGAVQRDAAGKPSRLTVTVHDVTAFRRMENELRSRSRDLAAEVRQRTDKLRDSELRLKTVLDEAPIILWAVDKDGVLTLSEGHGLTRIGIEPGEHVGMSAFELYKDEPAMIDNIRRALKGETVRGTLYFHGRTFEMTNMPLRAGHDGAVIGAMGVAVDITGKKPGTTKPADEAGG